MTSARYKPEMDSIGHISLELEVTGQKEPTPRLISVIIHNLSMGGVTLAAINAWDITGWDRHRGEDCVLRVKDSEGQKVAEIKAKITWTKVGGRGQPPMYLGLQLVKPSGEALYQLSGLLPHASQDIKELWDRYDQVLDTSQQSPLLHHCYIAGLVLLMGGLVLQFSGSPPYTKFGWALWLLGSLGIAGKIIWPLMQKRAAGNQIGKTL
jgi:hypothetical protein